MHDDAFNRDLRLLLVERLKKGEIDRRDFLVGLMALGGAVALPGAAANAQAKEIVLVNWGGDAVKFMADAFGAPFEKDTGIKVVVDSSGPSLAKIKAMVEGGKVTWDVCDSGAGTSFELGKAGLLERIDYSIVDKSQIPEAFAMPWALGSGAYSYVIAYDSAKVGATPPQSWAEFWDVKRWPGKRTMRKSMHSVLEAALMADGVPKDKLYPLDVKRAFDKLRQIKIANGAFPTVPLEEGDRAREARSGGESTRCAPKRVIDLLPATMVRLSPWPLRGLSPSSRGTVWS
jgi:putative spermidine/putrescine transport system substrate-binding protein